MMTTDPTCTYCPAPAAVTDDAGHHYCAACALSLADVLWAELREAWRERVEAAVQPHRTP